MEQRRLEKVGEWIRVQVEVGAARGALGGADIYLTLVVVVIRLDYKVLVKLKKIEILSVFQLVAPFSGG